MSNFLRILGFLCFLSMTFVILGVGCTSEEAKESFVSPPVTSEPTDTGPQETTPPPVETKKKSEEPLPPSKPEIEPEIARLETEKDDAASGKSAPPAEFAIASGLWEEKTKGHPKFTHEKHVEAHKVECNQCHHVYVDGKNTWKEGMAVAKCGECHDEPTIKNETKLPPEDQKKNLKLAFHNNCRACHKALKKEKPETKAPVTCKQCHSEE